MNLSLCFMAFKSNISIFKIFHYYSYFFNIFNYSQNSRRIPGGVDTEYGSKITGPRAYVIFNYFEKNRCMYN